MMTSDMFRMFFFFGFIFLTLMIGRRLRQYQSLVEGYETCPHDPPDPECPRCLRDHALYCNLLIWITLGFDFLHHIGGPLGTGFTFAAYGSLIFAAWESRRHIPATRFRKAFLSQVTGLLNDGDIQKAQATLDRHKRDILFRWDPEVKQLSLVAEAFEEAELLGVTVRMLTYRIEDGPQHIRDLESINEWYVGRVEDVDDNVVSIVFSTTEEPRRAFRKEMSRKDWLAACDTPPERDQYLEIAEYGALIQIAVIPVDS